MLSVPDQTRASPGETQKLGHEAGRKLRAESLACQELAVTLQTGMLEPSQRDDSVKRDKQLNKSPET